MDTFLQDLRYALRLHARAPLFALLAALTLGLGLGAATAIFSAVHALLLRPLPYPAPERLFTVAQNQSLLDLEDIQVDTPSLRSAGCVTFQALDDTGGAEPVQVRAALTDRGLFDVLGARPLLGRTFDEREDAAGGERVAVLSYGYWQRRFGGDAGVLGQALQLSGNPFTVVGVLPPSFALPEGPGADLYAPLRVVNPAVLKFRGIHFLRPYFRLDEGVALEKAQAEMELAARHLAANEPAESRGRRLRLIPLRDQVVGDTRPALLVLLGAVGLVLLVAASNFANLLLARSLSRRREVLIRASLGAGRGRLARQLLTESLLLSLLGGGLGLVLAPWLIRLLVALGPALPAVAPIRLDGAVVAFALALSLAVGALFGLVPAWSATSLSGGLAESGRSGTAGPGRTRLSGLLVVAEVALAVVLVVGAGLLVRTFWRLRATSPGFDPRGVVTMRIELPERRYPDLEKQVAFRRALLESVTSLPGVTAATVSELPLTGESLSHNAAFEGGDPVAVGDEPEVGSRSVSADYFRVMRIPILSGRGFTRDDGAGAPLVGVANQAMVREYFRGEDPIGKRVRWARQQPLAWITIVGVVADVRHLGLDVPEVPALYTPHDQTSAAWKRWMVLVARVEGGAAASAAAVEAIRSRIAAIDRDLPLTRVSTLAELTERSLAAQRFHMTLFGLFGALALVLAALGIYGVLSYAVAQRTREIGIRMALGAARLEVLGLVIGQGMRLSLAGIGLGVLGALALTRLLSGLLCGVSPTDTPTFLVLSLLLGGVALLACALPAGRATRVDPVVALRQE